MGFITFITKELQDFGLETELDNNGYLFATLESNIEKKFLR